MPENENAENWIGVRIGRLRRERGWTLATLAAKVDLSSTQLSRIESGARRASVGTLIEISRAFGVALSELVADEPTTAFHLVRADDRKPRDSANGSLSALSGAYPGLEAMHLEIPVGDDAVSARHAGEEWLYVLRGAIELTIGEEVLSLGPGDAVHFSSRSTHSVRNAGESTAELLLVSAGA